MGMFGLSRGGAQTDPAAGSGSRSLSRGGDAEDSAYGARDPAYEQSVSASAPAPTSPRSDAGAAGAALDSASSASLMVAVRTRPVLAEEHMRGVRKDILRVMDKRTVVVLDPDDGKRYLDRRGGRTKERRYTYDCAFGKTATNKDVYERTGKVLIDGVLNGRNGTVFAYGATGSGKTHTMVGDENDPGMMLLSLADIFDTARRHGDAYVYDVSCSYLEVYNELIYDLLGGDSRDHDDVPNKPSLELRDDPERGAVVAGLKRVKVADGDDVMELLRQGNARRKTEPTEANATSSRSHAVLEIEVVRRERACGYVGVQSRGKLSLVDLAGSERASETLNTGHKLRDGANINRSLLALANCINALGKKSTSLSNGKLASNSNVYVPFRNSKLTRLLKHALSGNSRTAMVANVSCGGDQYAHTVNTLKYADRAKEIRTHVVQNLQTVESHITDYQRLIDGLQTEVAHLKARVKQAEANANANANARDSGHPRGERANVGRAYRNADQKPALDDDGSSSREIRGDDRTAFASVRGTGPTGPGSRSGSGSRVPNQKPVANGTHSRHLRVSGAEPVPEIPGIPGIPGTRVRGPGGDAASRRVASPSSYEPPQSVSLSSDGVRVSRVSEKLDRERRRALERVLELFRENAEERLETQKCLYEHEDENARVRHFLSVSRFLSDADRKRSVVAVAENEAACLRYRTEIDVSDRAARALADKARELVVGGSLDESHESLESHASHAAAALAEALLRGRDAESAAAEAEFFLDVRESVIAEQRDAIDALAAALQTPERESGVAGKHVSGDNAPDAARHKKDALVAEALRKKASGERRLAFWDHQFEPPKPAAAAAGTESKARGADPAARVTPHGGAPPAVRSRVAAEDAAAMPPMPQTQPRRHDLGADPPRRRPGSGGARAGLGGGGRAGSGRRRASAGAPPEASVRSEGFSFGRDETARRETTPRDASASLGGETHSPHSPRGDKSSRPESGESAGSGGSRASSGVTSGVSDVSVLSFRDRDSFAVTKTAATKTVRERLVKAPKGRKEGRKPPVSASGVHGSGSRLRAMQREAARERSARTADRGIRGDRGFDPRGGLTVHTHAMHRSPSTERHRGGSARVSGPRSPHSPARRRPPVVTPEAFVIARPGT